MEKNITFDFKKILQSGKKVFGPLIGPGNDPDKTVPSLIYEAKSLIGEGGKPD